MAQLNPNFEIDFSDINSYEQIQLINDTQLAKENLLMHRAYKEPSDDEIIRNHFSSFTFVDFYPKVFKIKSPRRGNGSLDPDITNHYGLETFSELFDRINNWLKLNEDWRVVSMQTLIYDYRDQFNRLKSSTHSNYPPLTTRGLRLFLSPSKSRFSGPQKIGCINVIPRKIPTTTSTVTSHLSSSSPYSGTVPEPESAEGTPSLSSSSTSSSSTTKPSSTSSADNTNDSNKEQTKSQLERKPKVTYETLDQILQRLNEVLLTRPIEGRILSVETITLPMVNGYVDTEATYLPLMETLNALNKQTTYRPTKNVIIGQQQAREAEAARSHQATLSAEADSTPNEKPAEGAAFEGSSSCDRGHEDDDDSDDCGIEILRVYYEFGPMVCGLVNLIDFIPRFYSPTITTSGGGGGGLPNDAAEFLLASQPEANTAAFNSNNNNNNNNNNNESISAPICSQPISPDQQAAAAVAVHGCECEQRMNQKLPATETLTRLIRRSLTWFETERKRILSETAGQYAAATQLNYPSSSRLGANTMDKRQQKENNHETTTTISPTNGVDLKLCNLQVNYKTLFKAQLIEAKNKPTTSSSTLTATTNTDWNVQQLVNTRLMVEEKCNLVSLLAKQWLDVMASCAHCNCMNNQQPATSSSTSEQQLLKTIELQVQDRLMKSSHLIQLAQAYQLKYVRLAYIVPVYNKYAIRSAVWPLYRMRSAATAAPLSALNKLNKSSTSGETGSCRSISSQQQQSPSTSVTPMPPTIDKTNLDDVKLDTEHLIADDDEDDLDDNGVPDEQEEDEIDTEDQEQEGVAEEDEESDIDSTTSSSSSGGDDDSICEGDERMLKEILSADKQEEDWVKQFALKLVEETRKRHRLNEEAHQATESETSASSATGNETSLIGQLTYRLFAPCQLVNSSSCFAINPPSNSNSPLARRGSVDLKGSGSSSMVEPLIPIVPDSSNQQPMMVPGTSTQNEESSNSIRNLAPNEFESVEAIKRRMEIYVTTNSMKVIAGETLVVNLSDVLSCLSTAIEQTLVRSPYNRTNPSTWVSVYILYAAVDEPHLPSQLLAQQKLRELSLINEDPQEADEDGDDNFGNTINNNEIDNDIIKTTKNDEARGATSVAKKLSTTTKVIQNRGSLRVEQTKPLEASSTSMYNSAYDRTVALPTPPDASVGDSMWDLMDTLGIKEFQAHVMGDYGSDKKSSKKEKMNSHKFDKKYGKQQLQKVSSKMNLTAAATDGKRRIGGSKLKLTSPVVAVRGSRRRSADSQCLIM